MCFIILIVNFFLISNLSGVNSAKENAMRNDDVFVQFKNIFKLFTDFKNLVENYNSSSGDKLNGLETTTHDSYMFDIRYDTMPMKCNTTNTTIPKSCIEATSCTQRSGIYNITLKQFSNESFLVECDVKTEGGGWILIQRRQDGSIDFYRNWSEYQQGFGNIDGEFFIGLDKLHALTNYNGPQELLIVLDHNKAISLAKYSNFVVGNKSEEYALKHLGIYTGNAGDSLSAHMRSKFSTKDRDNDEYEGNCAHIYTGAWWYKKCHLSNLNGKYGDNTFGKGINWQTFRGYNISLKYVTMMIRRRKF